MSGTALIPVRSLIFTDGMTKSMRQLLKQPQFPLITWDARRMRWITNPYPTLKQYVFSRSMTERPDKHVELVRERVVETAGRLKAEAGKAIWLCGGGELASLLIETGLIDRLIIKLNPVVFGTGIPLFGRGKKPIALELTDSEIHGRGHVILHYTVRR